MEMEACGSGISSDEARARQRIITRKELFLYLKSRKRLTLTQTQVSEHLFDYLLSLYSNKQRNGYGVNIEQLKRDIKVFVNNMFTRYRLCHRSHKIFFKKYKEWVDQPFVIPVSLQEECAKPSTPKQTKGRPKKSFQCSSTRTKSRQVSRLVAEQDPSHLLFATQKSLQLAGKRVASKVIEIASSASPRRLKRMRQTGLSSGSQNTVTYTPDEALAMIVDCDLTKDAYIKIQQGAKLRSCNLYPSYKSIQEAKKRCYPESTIIRISETGVEADLQGLLDFTLERLLIVQRDVFARIIEVQSENLNVVCKWGFDGSGGHSIYKQSFNDSRLYGDSNIILCSVVPIEISNRSSDNNIIYWKACSASSTRFCRPLMFRILKETKENVLEMHNEVQHQILSLKPKQIEIKGKTINLNYMMLPTMFDGKIINILTGNQSTQSCYICKAKAGDMNDIEKLMKRVCDSSTYKYGLSILHAYIRMMELLLHVSYKLDLKKWQARGEQEKKLVKQKQQKISARFYNEMGLVVDLPKQGGGNSNDGNTARRFFSSPDKVAEITGLDAKLVYRFSVVLSSLASGYAIKLNKFRAYCLETAQIYTNMYKWYNMSVTVHKVLLHGADIIKSLPLPIGTLSEDIQEARQKDFKNIRLFHTRKTSRINTNNDIFNMLLITSDPIITSLRGKPKKKSVPFSNDVISFFENPEIFMRQDVIEDSVDDTDSELSDFV